MPPRSRPTVEDRSEERTEHDGARASVDVPDARYDGDTKAAGRASRRAGKASAELRIPLPDVGRRDPGRLLWYGGLGALAAIGVLEWPVAAVVGAATAIATRSRNDQGQPSAEQPRTRAQ